MDTQTITDRAREAATHLGPEWTTAPDPDWGHRAVRLTAPRDGGYPYVVQLFTDSGRLIARGRRPDITDSIAGVYRIPSQEITVSADSTGQRLAQHIKRRLLPPFSDALDRHAELAAEYEQRQVDVQRAVDLITAQLPKACVGPSYSFSNGRRISDSRAYGTPSITIDVDAKGTRTEVRITNLIPRHAAYVAELLRLMEAED
ncbi:hypothetical protein [Streptomyces sp. SS]|uniref:hypothetical protein n=1 Tax=Streptomyces sp. SS TaxID=260742 RepID=UPI0002EF6E11|nr:hypothetical protein [Streptomyces sp. SS]